MEKKSVGIWIRVSTEDQAKGESPEHHEMRARFYAESKGWHVAVVYHLEAMSGKSVMGYPQTKKMLKDIREQRITGLIFSKLARLARNTKELLEFADIFNEEDADLISLQEAIDTSTPAGRLFYTMIAAMAQWEREEISDRVAASVPIRAKLGKPIGGQASLGYKWEGKELVIDEQFAPVRKLIYELFLKLKRKKTVANVLNEQGYRTRNGSKYSDATVVRLLRDPMAKGERRANYTKSLGEGKKWEYKPESEWVITACPALVSVELWNECNRLLDQLESKRKSLGPQPKHLLAGYVQCTCSKKMYVFHKSTTATYMCRTCKNRIMESDLDEIFHAQLKTFLLTDINMSEYLQKVQTELEEKEKLASSVQAEREAIKKKMARYLKLRIDEEVSKEVFAEEYKPLEEQLMQIDKQLPELYADVDFLKIQFNSSNVVLEDAKDLYTHWNDLAFEEKRNIVETITDAITIGKEDISIKLSYVPSQAQSPTFPLNGGTSQRNYRGS